MPAPCCCSRASLVMEDPALLRQIDAQTHTLGTGRLQALHASIGRRLQQQG
ncbi:hypothetical protein GCM10025868_18840 [Angustibacter aerolatus]|uniref:Uncharacterized protein n=1 Tax=Angustibacter aerolatus TaxID=1162965 RepID=A0ABQ6JGX9_9ACTN|nr:hypothetical protein [Angustibacter aerolatus]GMA86634.1 hypothetical protein GCM10025868_18840 [Angustibacter aerolatus]